MVAKITDIGMRDGVAAPIAPVVTSLHGEERAAGESSTGRSRSRTWSSRVKMAVLAPIPRARVRTATAVKPGCACKHAKRVLHVTKTSVEPACHAQTAGGIIVSLGHTSPRYN